MSFSLCLRLSFILTTAAFVATSVAAQDSPVSQSPATLTAPAAPVTINAETRSAPVVAPTPDTAVNLIEAQGVTGATEPPANQPDNQVASNQGINSGPSVPETEFDASTNTVEAPTPAAAHPLKVQFEHTAAQALQFLHDGGPSIWAIAALSVLTMALILWKIWRLVILGAWSQGRTPQALEAWSAGQRDHARALIARRRGLRSKVVRAAFEATTDLPEQSAREETTRVAKKHLAEAASGLRALELIATIAPLLGLLGTVMGMIAAFQALQESGSRADPSLLAGGIWEALLTTAAGMAVAIPASAALTWFEAVVDRLRRDVEDAASRVFIANALEPAAPVKPALVAE